MKAVKGKTAIYYCFSTLTLAFNIMNGEHPSVLQSHTLKQGVFAIFLYNIRHKI
jgi:hypothetical protein